MATPRSNELAILVDDYLALSGPTLRQAQLLAVAIGTGLRLATDNWVVRGDEDGRILASMDGIKRRAADVVTVLRLDADEAMARHRSRRLARELSTQLARDFARQTGFFSSGESSGYVQIHDLLHGFDASLTDGEGIKAAEALVSALDQGVVHSASRRWRQLAACLYGFVALSERLISPSTPKDETSERDPALTALLPQERLASLDEPRLGLLRQVVEPLQDLARSLIDDGDLSPDDESELRSLLGSVTFELQNPRHDVVSLERNVGRLAVAVSRQQPADAAVERLVAELDVERDDAEQLIDEIKDLTESNTIGNPDAASDLDEATATLRHVPELLEGPVGRSIQQSLDDPDGSIAQRLATIERMLAQRPGSWPTSIAQNLAASALYDIFKAVGGPMIAFRAVVWTIIAVYTFAR